MSSQRTRTAFGLTAAALAGGAAWGQNPSFTEKQPQMNTPREWRAPAGAVAQPSGIRRIDSIVRLPAATFSVDGKNVPIDPATGEALIQSAKFFLPDNWQWGEFDDGEHDSYGRPIVSRTAGLPAWSQFDVDALRDAITHTRGIFESVRGGPDGSVEAEAVLGNFIGQAIVRGIQISDLIDLNDANIVTPGVAASIFERMHSYELTRAEAMNHAALNYTPSVYGDDIVKFVESRGSTMAELLSLETPSDEIVTDRAVPGGCYLRIPGNGYGLSVLSGATTIWEGDGTDDASADVPIGFPFNFYECEDQAQFTGVRVSTNGYLTFYQHGGAAANGVEYVNAAIGTGAAPNGFVAGYWDDLQVLNQGNFADKVSWKIEGTPGSRVLTVEWFSMSRRNGSTTDYHSFQILLHEHRFEAGSARSIVTLAYGEPGTWWQADPLDTATVGMEGFSGTNGDCIDTCNILTDIPSRNFIFQPLSNDLCDNMLPINVGGEIVDDLTAATSDTSQCGNGHGDRWYYFEAPASGTLTIDTCGTHDMPGVDQGVDTLISVWAGCPGNGGTLVACDDDGGTNCGDQGNVRDSRLSVPVINGNRVAIRVTSFSAVTSFGKFKLHAQFVPNQLAGNDNCQNAYTFLTSSVSSGGNLLTATSDGSAACSFGGEPDLWYRYVPALSGTLKVDTCSTNDRPGIDRGLDTVLSLHTGCPGNTQNQVACNDDWASGCEQSDTSFILDSSVRAPFNAGQAAIIRVTSFSAALVDGYFNIHVYFLPADLNGDCHVDLTDLATLLSHFGSASGQTLAGGDVDGDGDVDLTDLANLLSRFGLSCE